LSRRWLEVLEPDFHTNHGRGAADRVPHSLGELRPQISPVMFAAVATPLATEWEGVSTERLLRAGLASAMLLVTGLNDLKMWIAYAWPGWSGRTSSGEH